MNPPVEAPRSAHTRPATLDLKMIQRRLQLGACPAGKLKLVQHADFGFRIDLLAGFFNLLLIDQNPAGQQQRLGFVPALGDSTLYEQLIDTSFHRIMQCD